MFSFLTPIACASAFDCWMLDVCVGVYVVFHLFPFKYQFMVVLMVWTRNKEMGVEV